VLGLGLPSKRSHSSDTYGSLKCHNHENVVNSEANIEVLVHGNY
jgi:hypothetical protein